MSPVTTVGAGATDAYRTRAGVEVRPVASRGQLQRPQREPGAPVGSGSS
jgi:hypothetical protein